MTEWLTLWSRTEYILRSSSKHLLRNQYCILVFVVVAAVLAVLQTAKTSAVNDQVYNSLAETQEDNKRLAKPLPKALFGSSFRVCVFVFRYTRDLSYLSYITVVALQFVC